MDNRKKTSAALACLVWVSGCASPANQAALADVRATCTNPNEPMWRRDIACARIPQQEAINKQEANRNLGMALFLPLLPLLPLAILVALAESDDSSGGGYYYGSHHHGGHHHGHHGGGHHGGGHHGGHR